MRNTILILFLALFELYGISQNPFLPPYAFIPDGEPHVFKHNGEERLYIYGSRDETTVSYCGKGHDLWSASVDDLTKWKFHGEILNFDQVKQLGDEMSPNQYFYAPDCVYNPVTKKYYIYTFTGGKWKANANVLQAIKKENAATGFSTINDEKGPNCFMAMSDTPYGPFTNPTLCDWPSNDKNRTFDPSVVVLNQPDGSVRVWAYWGFMRSDTWAEIDPTDMHTIINSKTRKPDRSAIYKTLNNPTLNRNETLFEASSIKQVDKDKFVFVFSANSVKNALSYCYSNSPEGPWTYGGIIVNNNKKGGNNHGSIVKVKNQWYVVYHRQTPNNYNRQAMIEPIDLRIEGDKVVIPEVEMTSQGIFKDGLPFQKRYWAGIVCSIDGKAFVDGKRREKDGYNPVVVDSTGSVLGYKYFNFGTTALKNLTCMLNLKASNKFSVKLELMPKNGTQRILIAEQEINPSGKGKDSFTDYKISAKDLDKRTEFSQNGGIMGSMALFITVKQGTSAIEIKELELLTSK